MTASTDAPTLDRAIAETEAWHQDRLAALRDEGGWLNLTDRIENAPGRYRLGRAEDNDLHLSTGPDHLGVLVLTAAGRATLEADTGVMDFLPVPDAYPRLRAGGLILEMTELEGDYALRVRDPDHPGRVNFAGIARYPYDPEWRIMAQWEVLPTPEALGIDTALGVPTTVRITHRARFVHQGQEVTLLPTHWKSGKPMFVIRDVTSGVETYGASRFLIGAVQGDRVVLDFNRAFNPPCAFTDLATCPLPPRENILNFAIRAGEKRV